MYHLSVYPIQVTYFNVFINILLQVLVHEFVYCFNFENIAHEKHLEHDFGIFSSMRCPFFNYFFFYKF